MASERKMIAPIHNMLALINPVALPALRIAATFFLFIYLLAGAYYFATVIVSLTETRMLTTTFRPPVTPESRLLYPLASITTLSLALLIYFWIA